MRAWLACAWLALAAGTARGDDADRAKALYEAGLQHYDAGKYADAIEAWQEAYGISSAPLLLFNIGQAYRLSGDCSHALEFYDRYTTAQPNPDNRGELDQATKECKDKLAAPPPVQPIPPQPPAPVPTPPPPAIVATTPHGHGRTIGYVVGAAGLAAAGAATWFAVEGRRLERDVQSISVWTATDGDEQARGRRDNTFAYVFGGVGAAAVITGAILVITGGTTERAVAVAPTRGGAAVGLTVRF